MSGLNAGALAIQKEWDTAAKALSQSTRQRFLDAIWAGNNIGESRKIASMTFEEAIGTMNMNIDQVTFNTLLRFSP